MTHFIHFFYFALINKFLYITILGQWILGTFVQFINDGLHFLQLTIMQLCAWTRILFSSIISHSTLPNQIVFISHSHTHHFCIVLIAIIFLKLFFSEILKILLFYFHCYFIFLKLRRNSISKPLWKNLEK